MQQVHSASHSPATLPAVVDVESAVVWAKNVSLARARHAPSEWKASMVQTMFCVHTLSASLLTTCLAYACSGSTWCGQSCIQLERNPYNCGACGHSCLTAQGPLFYSLPSCKNSTCSYRCLNDLSGPQFSDPAKCTTSCFPADASVHLASGASVRISALRPGNRVLVARSDGALAYSDVYMMSHAEGTATAPYILLRTAVGATLRLSPLHFAYVADSTMVPFSARREVQAQHVRPGQHVWVVAGPANATHLQLARVTGEWGGHAAGEGAA